MTEEPLERGTAYAVRRSTIFIASGPELRVYRSLDDVPAGLMRDLRRSTQGPNAATILIADRAGRAELARTMRGIPSRLDPWFPDVAARTQATRTKTSGRVAPYVRPMRRNLPAGRGRHRSLTAGWSEMPLAVRLWTMAAAALGVVAAAVALSFLQP